MFIIDSMIKAASTERGSSPLPALYRGGMEGDG